MIPALIVLSSAIPGVLIFILAEDSRTARITLNLSGAILKLLLIAYLFHGVSQGRTFDLRFALMPGYDFVLQANALALLFVSLSAVLWLLTTIYAIGYLEGSPNLSRFFGFFSLCVSATTGIALAANPLTFLIFYETLTLATYPLVVHHGDRESLAAGRTYLVYTLAGGAVVFLATMWLHSLAGPLAFTQGGALRATGATAHPDQLVAIFALFIAGFGVKTGLVPLHSWLPAAMVAPAPVSALLHAVAVVKAGAFGIMRVTYEVFGIELADDLGVLIPLSIVACVTIIYGSLRALAQDDLKKRLAYSTVSQVSYIVLGISLFGPLGTIGGLAHLVHQGIMKITLFFCAGSFAETLGVKKVSQMNGIGRRMPLTMIAFTITALGMIGIPPLVGFISKWYLGLGAVTALQPWVLAVLMASTLLNAAYFLPIIHVAWFRERTEPWPVDHGTPGVDGSWWLLAPPLVTAALTIILGLLAEMPFSVQTWAQLIVRREYL